MALETERFSSHARARLSAVLQTARELVTIEDAIKALAVDRHAATKILSRWQQQGWLKRVGRGIYAPIPARCLHDGTGAQGSMGAGSGVVRARLHRRLDCRRTLGPYGTAFPQHLRVHRPAVSQQRANGARRVIHAQTHPGRCAFWNQDSLARPGTGFDRRQTPHHRRSSGGPGDGRRHSPRRSLPSETICAIRKPMPTPSIRYAEKLGNGAVFKRLGFLVSRMPGKRILAESCRQRLTRGQRETRPRARPAVVWSRPGASGFPRTGRRRQTVIDRREFSQPPPTSGCCRTLSKRITFSAGSSPASSTIRRWRRSGYSRAEPVSRSVISKRTASPRISISR